MRISYFASVPYPEVTASLARLSESGLHLEIEVTDPQWILQVCELPMARKLGSTIRDRGLRLHVEGPFLDLAPGSLDPFIREHTRKLFLRTVEIAGSLGAQCLTLYSGYNPLLHSRVLNQWLEVCFPLWLEVAEEAERHQVRLLFANLFEEGPEIQLELIQACNSGLAGACLDVAHVHMYSKKKPSSWVKTLGDSLSLVHLYDTRGKDDEPLALGEGRVNLKEFFQACLRKQLVPDIAFKLPLDQAVDSLRAIRKLGLGQLQMELL